MVIDTSAIMAIIFEEPEAETFLALLTGEVSLSMSVATYYEASVVLAGKKQNRYAIQDLDTIIRDLSVNLIPVSIADATAARDAYFQFGRGYHPAALNLCDCFSYALAKALDEPLLFNGNDFRKTDVLSAWTP
jgi:ribonuclease VapC